ncbi:MAG: MmcQ/YjbR family DNA-binding protein [Ignavibacteriaceae bacterium]
MDLETIRNHCLKKNGVTEELPFNENTPVYKVMGKMFLLASLSYPVSINLKCDPEKAVDLRERYSSVTPGYHMNKTHWNTVVLDGSVPNKEILKWIDDSYELVVGSLKKNDKDKMNLNSD